MRKYLKYTVIVLVPFIVVSSVIVYKFHGEGNDKKIVSAAQMKAYGKAYFREYEYLINKQELFGYRKYFSFPTNKSFLTKATISSSKGAAVEIILLKKQDFKCQNVTTPIERVFMLGRGDYNNIETKYGTVSIRTITKGNADITIAKDGRIFKIFNDNNDVNNSKIVIIKGSNLASEWSRTVAVEDAMFCFSKYFRNIYLSSEEFRKLLACPETTQIANEITKKEKNGEYGKDPYGYLEYKEDIAILGAIAVKYNIKHEFTENVYEFVKGQPNWRERNPIKYALMLTFFGAFLVWCFTRIRQKIWSKIKIILGKTNKTQEGN